MSFKVFYLYTVSQVFNVFKNFSVCNVILQYGQLATIYHFNGTNSKKIVTTQNIDLIKLNQTWRDNPTILKFTCRFLTEVPEDVYDQFLFNPVLCLKPDVFLIECAKELISMNIKQQRSKGFTMKSNGGKPSPSVPSQHMYTSTTTQGIWVTNFQTSPNMHLVENAKKFMGKCYQLC